MSTQQAGQSTQQESTQGVQQLAMQELAAQQQRNTAISQSVE